MKSKEYYVVDCISGCRDEIEPITDINEARAFRDRLNAERVSEGGSSDFWIIVDGNGKTVK